MARHPTISPSTDPKIRVVRKYYNRRLYDTATAKHINHDELLGIDGRVLVLDAKTGADLTARTFAEAMHARIDWTQPQALTALKKIYERAR